MSRLAAFLLEQTNGIEAHAAVYCFTHVVDRQQAHADGGQRFHFDAGAPYRFCCSSALHRVARFVDVELYGDSGQCNGMAQRNQIRSAFSA
jgi:hypothetical protein